MFHRNKKSALQLAAVLMFCSTGYSATSSAADAASSTTIRVRASDILGQYATPAPRPSALLTSENVQALSGEWRCDWVEYCTVTKTNGEVSDVSCGDWQQENCEYDPGDFYNPGDGGHDYWGGSGGSSGSTRQCYTRTGTTNITVSVDLSPDDVRNMAKPAWAKIAEELRGKQVRDIGLGEFTLLVMIDAYGATGAIGPFPIAISPGKSPMYAVLARSGQAPEADPDPCQ